VLSTATHGEKRAQRYDRYPTTIASARKRNRCEYRINQQRISADRTAWPSVQSCTRAVRTGVALGGATLELMVRSRREATIAAVDFPPAFPVIAAVSAASAVIFARLPPDPGPSLPTARRRETPPPAGPSFITISSVAVDDPPRRFCHSYCAPSEIHAAEQTPVMPFDSEEKSLS
jgi:hypothetical protein